MALWSPTWIAPSLRLLQALRLISAADDLNYYALDLWKFHVGLERLPEYNPESADHACHGRPSAELQSLFLHRVQVPLRAAAKSA